MTDPFSELDVLPGAAPCEIRAAYRAQARKWHPDKFPEGPERAEAEARMIRLNRAYEEAMGRAPSRAAQSAPASRHTHSRRGRRSAPRRSLADGDGPARPRAPRAYARAGPGRRMELSLRRNPDAPRRIRKGRRLLRRLHPHVPRLPAVPRRPPQRRSPPRPLPQTRVAARLGSTSQCS